MRYLRILGDLRIADSEIHDEGMIMERKLYGEGPRCSEEQQEETAEDPERKKGGKKSQKRRTAGHLIDYW
jgi:hypothetical protein